MCGRENSEILAQLEIEFSSERENCHLCKSSKKLQRRFTLLHHTLYFHLFAYFRTTDLLLNVNNWASWYPVVLKSKGTAHKSTTQRREHQCRSISFLCCVVRCLLLFKVIFYIQCSCAQSCQLIQPCSAIGQYFGQFGWQNN